ncbi:hypothetical protein LOK49_LG15G00252 [Camellia lanceoleosa]|uniref:Uncharacterized protein n=1 Tax=Camellia lanceoleosa TaxID=1840588 RepID=A0ACC0F4J0_9ERIC|nr:hypothetical protein LOK49_LG15G00252 [Camellia lanceoleosa]
MRALVSLFDHELEFEFVPVDLKAGDLKKEPFLSLSPFGQDPIFEDGDMILFESRAIMRCISHLYPKPGKEQVYMEPKMQGIAAAWIDVEDHQFHPPASKLISELVYKAKNGQPANEAVVAEEEAKLARVLDVYEERLIDSKFLGVLIGKTSRPSLSATMKVHGSVMSTAAQRVFACLNEKELEFEFVPVDMRSGEHKQPHFLSLNPFGQVPALQDGDLTLFESRAISQYIAHTYADKGNQLICQDPKKMAILSVWMEVEAHQFDPVASKLCFELLYKSMFGMKTDDAVVEENEAKLAKVLDVYEARLAHSKYIGGDCFTLADLHHLPNTQILMATQAKKLFDSRPHWDEKAVAL